MAEADMGVEAVRRARKEISREHDNDPRRLVEYYMRLQARHKDRLIDGASPRADSADGCAEPLTAETFARPVSPEKPELVADR